MSKYNLDKSGEGTDNGGDAFSNKQKLKMLKDAIRELRNEKSEMESQIKELKISLSAMERIKEEKVFLLIKLCIKVQDNIILLAKIDSLSDSISDLKQKKQNQSADKNQSLRFQSASQQNLNSSNGPTFFNVFKQNGIASQTQFQAASTKKEIDSLNQQIKKLAEYENLLIIASQNDQALRDYTRQLEALTMGKKKLEEDQRSREFQFRDLQNQYVQLSDEYKQLKEQYENQEAFITKRVDEVEDLKIKNKYLECQVYEREQMLQQRDLKLSEYQMVINQNVNEKIQFEYQKEISEAQRAMQVFQVTKLGIVNIQCLFILRSNVQNKPIVEIETAAGTYIIKASEVRDLIPDRNKDNEFQLTIQVKTIFRISSSKEIRKELKLINLWRQNEYANLQSKFPHFQKQRVFLQKALEDKKSEDSIQQQPKGFLQGITSLFGKQS